MKIAALQLETQALSNARLDYYLRICEQRGARIVALSEYVINSFFTDLVNTPKQLILEQSKVKIEAIKEYSKNYNLCIIAPVVLKEKSGLKKSCIIANKGVVKYYNQQILMPYSHWNEAEFFNNPKKPLKLYSFKCDNFKIGIMFGYEMHFDELFSKASELDLLIVPCANTYNSNQRWYELFKTRAFLKNINILRINRVGTSMVDELEWDFYGNSFLCDGHGQIVHELGDKEEILIADISKSNEAVKFWQFAKVSKEIEKRIL